MSVFDKWRWIKRNWPYIIEEATKLELVFVGGTVLNLVLFKEYRASEDIDLYDPNAKSIGTVHEEECIKKLAERLREKGFEISSLEGKSFLIGPNIKVEVFNDATSFNKIEKRIIDQTDVRLFDLMTYSEMKMAALLCRTNFDSRDLVDLFILRKQTGSDPTFPKRECDIIDNRFDDRLSDIKRTKREDLRIFQTDEQIDGLPYGEFEEFKRWLYDWLSGFR
jgi:hypothetical protein